MKNSIRCNCGQLVNANVPGDAVAELSLAPRDTINGPDGKPYPVTQDGKSLTRFDEGKPVYETPVVIPTVDNAEAVAAEAKA